LLLLSGFTNAFAQKSASIEGIISSHEGPIPGATVQVAGTTQGTAADSQGKYILQDLKPGPVTLEFRSIGFMHLKKEVILETNRTLQIDVTLEENKLGLDEVVITGTMKPTFVTASPIKVEVVTSEYLNTYMPAAASSVVEGLKLVNGIQEVVACGVCFTNSISINGLPGP